MKKNPLHKIIAGKILKYMLVMVVILIEFGCTLGGDPLVIYLDAFSVALKIVNNYHAPVHVATRPVVSDENLKSVFGGNIGNDNFDLGPEKQRKILLLADLNYCGTDPFSLTDFSTGLRATSFRLELDGITDEPYIALGWPEGYSTQDDADRFGLLYCPVDGKQGPQPDPQWYCQEYRSSLLPPNRRFNSDVTLEVTITETGEVQFALSQDTLDRLVPAE